VQDRLQEYNQKTAPLLNFYKERSVLTSFEVKKGMKDLPQVIEVVELFAKR